MTKEEIRKAIRLQKRALQQEEMELQGKQIFHQITKFQDYQTAGLIFTYMSYNQEVDTTHIILDALASGKQVAVPKVEGREIVFYYIESLEQMVPGYQGILEPKSQRVAVPEHGMFMIMPGLAFSTQGQRIGYGGGFYDRYLDQYHEESFVTCAVAYDFQVFDSLPSEEFDQRIDYIITANQIYSCR